MDHHQNKKGKELLQKMSSMQLMLLNGRTTGDIPGNFTFMGNQGGSTIDLFFVNNTVASQVSELKILHSELSDHFPLRLSVGRTDHQALKNYTSRTKLVYEPDKQIEYVKHIRHIMSENSSTHTYEGFRDAITKAAQQAGMQRKYGGIPNGKVWFDRECKEAKCKTKLLFKQGKYNNWAENTREEFIAARKTYRALYKAKKEEHDKKQQNMLHNLKSTNDFWKTIKRLNYTPTIPNNIPENEWSKFYKESQDPRKGEAACFQDVRHKDLDNDITLEELLRNICKISTGKAAGSDGITNELLKNLPVEIKCKMVDIFNRIWTDEEVPPDWQESVTVMLHKKGDPENPANFRPIALLNTMLKLFTTILQERIMKWAEDCHILPESQAGFRKGRGCEDQIFTLQSTLQIGTRKGKVYAIFIDFARAFNSIQQNKLWDKLFKLGLSGKIIRILRNLYNNSHTKVNIGGNLTQPIELTIGLLQGESLSPTLFNLYISDMDEKFAEWGIPGIKVDWTEIHNLAYADDRVCLAPGYQALQRKIDKLGEYFDDLELIVNLSKTKIMEFRRHQRKSNKHHFYKGQLIERVEKYKYLGVEFHSNLLFNDTEKATKNNGKATAARVISILKRGKSESIEPVRKLYRSIISPTIQYCTHIWGLRQIKELEKVQTYYYKRALGISTISSNAAVNLEVNAECMEYNIYSSLFRFLIKLWQAPEGRLIKSCYNQLLRNSTIKNEEEKFNWCRQVKSVFGYLGYSYIWEQQCIETLLGATKDVFITIQDMKQQQWIADVNSSPHYQHYSKLEPKPAYLQIRAAWEIKKIMAQCRLNRNSVYINGRTYIFDIEGNCRYCNSCTADNITHMVVGCKRLRHYRQKLIGIADARADQEQLIFCNYLNSIKDRDTMYKFYRFMQLGIKERLWEDDETSALGL